MTDSAVSIIASVVTVLAAGGITFFIVSGRKPSGKTVPSPVKALSFLADGKDGEALESLKEIALQRGGLPEVYAALAVLYRKTGNPLKGMVINEGILLKGGLSCDDVTYVLKELNKCYKIAKNSGNAVSVIKHTESKCKGSPELYLTKALLAEYSGDLDEAVKYTVKYEKNTGVSRAADISSLYYVMAVKASDSGRKIKLLRQSLKFNKNNRAAHYMLADIYLKNNKLDRCIDVLKEIIIQNHIRSKEDLDKIENIFFTHSLLDELYDFMASMVQGNASTPAPYLYLYNFHMKKGEKEKAGNILRNYLLSRNCNIILKEYVRATEDAVALNFLNFSEIYRCNACGTKTEFFSEACPSCGTEDSLYYI